ncbi:restriction endonuclease subunit S [Glutamicibacter ardleyensis]|uniref:restriction endonuclease subunit S n=1 Tax=Glutamicibacter ardleyensis TaxID=225894 RepID=UPI003FCF08A3
MTVTAGRKSSESFWYDTIPQAWAEPSLRHLAAIRNGSDYKDFQVDVGGYPVFGSGGEFARTSRYLHDGESVLLGRKGTVDKPLYVNGRFWTVDTMFYTSIGRRITAKYLHYFAMTIPYDYFQTNTAVPSMTQGDLGAIKVPLPSLEQQQCIVAFLDRETAQIDELIIKQEQLIELLAEKRQAIITHAVSKGLDTSAPTKPSDIPGLGNIPVHWRISKLSWESIGIGDGLHGTPQYSDHGSIPFINGTNLLGGSIRITDSTRFVEEDHLSNADMALTESTVLMSINGTVGNCAVLGKQRVMLSKSAAYITCADSLRTQFLAHFLRSQHTKDYFRAASGGTTIANLSLATLRGTPIPVPPLEEQDQLVRSIENQLRKIGDLANKTNSALKLLRERRSALIAATVTGKIRVV